MNFLRNTWITTHNKAYPNHWDMLALIFVLSIISLLAWNAKQMTMPYQIGQPLPISLDPIHLPAYAARTVMRMLFALGCSLLFTFTIATWAAKSKRAEKIIIPIIDVLQSVPILGFLSITLAGFIALFPGSLLGPECAVIFVLFTSQAWNMALGFYQTISSVPVELKEAAEMFHLSAWQQFWRIEVPFSMPGLLWNMMMSMSAGWFFVVWSEAITVNNQNIFLPGIGSYIKLAVDQANMPAIGYAILTMFIVILIYDQVLFRPLVAWAEKFKAEQVASDRESGTWLIDLLRRTRFLRFLGQKIEVFLNRIVNMAWLRSKENTEPNLQRAMRVERWLSVVWFVFIALILLSAACSLIYFVRHSVSWELIKHVVFLGIISALRVFVMIVVCSLVWVPIGVWIGLRPRVAEIIQPVAQFLAAFPANLLYPLVVIMIVTYNLNVNIWVTPLVMLGAQWYILFNVIAGASVIPKDLLQVVDNLGLSTLLRWRRLILPCIFPYFITGAITAAGGAWNATIAAEVVSWGNKKLAATGLGAYIAQYTDAGDFIHIAIGIGAMCIFVLLFNRMLWRPLYRLAQSRYSLD